MNTQLTQYRDLAQWLRQHPRPVIITGAGISAESGIPTWRDREGRWLRRDPIRHGEYLADVRVRRRYWGRSMVGWPQMRSMQPNRAHHALAELEDAGRLRLLITQNVDRLHQRAGSRSVVDLHGRLDRVHCLDCGASLHRDDMQHALQRLNPQMAGRGGAPLPDGDAALEDRALRDFAVPDCEQCGGMLMPDVVFFGGTVPRQRVDECMQAVAEADGVLAVGSSLQVFSGFRFCRHAHRLGKPLAILNPGRSRADDLAGARFVEDCGPALQRAVAAL